MAKLAYLSVCIVGASSMRAITGYDLQQTGVAVTFLIRPHRQAPVARIQVIYSYDDQRLKTYAGYSLLTDPEQLIQQSFDFIRLTLDGAALRAEAGLKVVEAIGKACCNTSTGIS